MEPTRISHYELRRLLGRGGMGEVYEAFDLKARRAVALKFVAPELASEPAAFRRFESEALNAAALTHPHIATLYEFEPEGARPFIAMELVAGPSLRQRIEAGPFEVAEGLEVARDVAAALAYAHRRGIVHRDIKPENLMFDQEGRAKVMDFGLARALMASRLTLTGSSLGTPSYMAPESVQQGSGGPPADVFALGLVLVEMLTGEQVFRGDSPLSVMFAIAHSDPPPLREKRPDAPEPVERLIQRMLDKDPEQRLDAAAAARELAQLTGMRVSQLVLGTGEPVRAAAAVTESSPTIPIGSGGTSGARVTESSPTIPVGGGIGATPPVTGSSPTIPIAARAAGETPSGTRRAPARRTWVFLALLAVAVIAVGVGLLMAGAATARRARQAEAVALNNQAHTALQRGDLAAAERLVELALKRDPRYAEALFNRAALYAQKGSLDSAATLYAAIARSHAGDSALMAMVLYNLGDIDLRQDAPDQAIKHLGQSFAYDSSGWQVYNNFGHALVKGRRSDEALALLERGIARFPGAAPLHKNAALAALTLGRDREALAHVDHALARDPGLASAYGLRARVRSRLHDPRGAQSDWILYLASDPPPEERLEVQRELIARGVPADYAEPRSDAAPPERP